MGASIPAALLGVALITAPAGAAEIDPDADQILRAMSDHLAGLESFSIETEAVTEIILRNGQKIQAVATGEGVFDRTRGFHFRRAGVIGDIELIFDGSNLTLYVAGLNGYRSVAVEGGNDAALDDVRAVFGIEAAGGVDLLYSNPYEGLRYEVESGQYFGVTTVGGVPAHHIAYRAAQVDWQLWVQAEGDPLPLRYVVTSKWMATAPQFTVEVRKWDTASAIEDAAFTFTPPDGAKKLDAIAFDELGNPATE